MKKIRVLALALTALMVLGMLAGCSTSASDITVTLKFITDSGVEYFNQPIKVNSENPTVELVVNEANMEYTSLGCTWDDKNQLSLAEYPDTTLEDGSSLYWEFTVNGEEATAKANSTAVTDGAVVEFVYTKYVPEETTQG